MCYTVIFLILFMVEIDLQGSIKETKAETLTIQGQQCAGYYDLIDEVNVTEVEVLGTSMQYFPEGDCNNAVPDADLRVLNLPNLKQLIFKENKLFKIPNVSGF